MPALSFIRSMARVPNCASPPRIPRAPSTNEPDHRLREASGPRVCGPFGLYTVPGRGPDGRPAASFFALILSYFACSANTAALFTNFPLMIFPFFAGYLQQTS